MARVDAARGAVELTIVYVGWNHTLTGAAATALHTALKDVKSEPISLSMGGDRVVVFSNTPREAGALDGLSVTVRCSAIVGVAQRSTYQEQLSEADGVVLVLPAGSEAQSDNEAAVQRLFDDLTLRGEAGRDLPLVVMLDGLVNQEPQAVSDFLSSLGLAGVPYFASNVSAQAGVLDAYRGAYELAAQRVMDSEELRSSSAAVLVRERRLQSKLNHIEQSVVHLGEHMLSLVEKLSAVSDTLVQLKAEGAHRDKELRALRRLYDDQSAATRKLVDEQTSATRKLIQQTTETANQTLLAELRDAVTQAHGVELERLSTLSSLVKQSNDGIDSELKHAASSLQRDIAALVEGMEELRADARQKRRGFWRSAGT